MGKASPWSLRRLTVKQRRNLEKMYIETVKRWRSESVDLNPPTLQEFYYFLLHRAIEHLRKLLREEPAAFMQAIREIRRRSE